MNRKHVNFSLLARFVDRSGFETVPLRKPNSENRSPTDFCTIEKFLEDHRETAMACPKRIKELNACRRVLENIIPCGKTLRVVLQLADGAIRQSEVAIILGISRHRVCREVKRIHCLIKQQWPDEFISVAQQNS